MKLSSGSGRLREENLPQKTNYTIMCYVVLYCTLQYDSILQYTITLGLQLPI